VVQGRAHTSCTKIYPALPLLTITKRNITVFPGPARPEDYEPPVYGKPKHHTIPIEEMREIPAIQGYIFSTKEPKLNAHLKLVLWGYVVCAGVGYIAYANNRPYEELRSKEDALIRYHLEDSDDKLLSLINGEMRPNYYRQKNFPDSEVGHKVIYNREM